MAKFIQTFNVARKRNKLASIEAKIAVISNKRRALKEKARILTADYEKTAEEIRQFNRENPQ